MSKATEAANRVLREKRERGELEVLDPLEKARRNPNSLRAAVNAKCWDCEGGDADPAPRWRIGNCVIEACPLWPVRPWQHLQGKQTPVFLRDADPEEGESSRDDGRDVDD